VGTLTDSKQADCKLKKCPGALELMDNKLKTIATIKIGHKEQRHSHWLRNVRQHISISHEG